ncbi:MAG TPA: hypothetical protein VGB13_13495 [Candidatus Krumholzibacteria bacterium]|jgi:hypothetical protein
MNWKLCLGARTLAVSVLLFSLVAALGCGEEEVVDPYVYATLDQVTRGYVESKQFLYEIDTPEFVFAQGNTAVVRSGSHLEILVGDDLENRAPTLQGKMIGVQKFFSPVVWIMAKRVKDGLNVTALDSVEAPVLPHFTDVKLEEVNGFDIGTLEWNKKATMDEMAGSSVQTVGTLHYLPDHQWEAPKVAAAADAAPDPVEPPMAWYLKAKDTDATFKISNMTPALEFGFRLLEAEGLPFIGGVTLAEPYTIKERRTSKISADIAIDWMRYANRYLAP